ncbi:MAG TPA: Ppx/GppA phosphatase family protein [Propionibacteriaceae bacterium]|jgi:exopolyphosphatase / guanosine-5'-triphosphate,3'-diphosphate pyrophosphatase
MTRVAAIDCGTNSIRLLIAEPNGSGGLRELDRRLEIVRLGQGVDANGEFHPDALQRTFAVVDQYAELIKKAEVPVPNVHFVATSAARDARNRDSFFAGIKQRLGVLPDVVSGPTEAHLSFLGALSRVTPEGQPVLVMDIGGGSTELITGSAAGEIYRAISLDVGSVRVTERFLKQNPVADDDLARATEYVDDLLAGSGVEFASIGTWIGVGGTATTLAGVHLELEHYDREQVHGAVIPLPAVQALLHRLAKMTVEEIKALPSMHPGRADVITGGALVEARTAARLNVAELIISESDILDGIALQLIHR